MKYMEYNAQLNIQAHCEVGTCTLVANLKLRGISGQESFVNNKSQQV